MLAATRSSGLLGLAMAATAAAVISWVVLAVYSAAGEHISSTAEDVAFFLALIAAAALIVAGLFMGLRSGWSSAGLILVGGIAILAVALLFAPTTW